jgi:hypothetical protein
VVGSYEGGNELSDSIKWRETPLLAEEKEALESNCAPGK